MKVIWKNPLSVFLFVFPEFFSVTIHRNFLNFCTWLGCNLKSGEAWFFFHRCIKAENWVKHFVKNCFWVFGAKKPKNGQEMRFWKFYGEWKRDIFLIFWMKFINAWNCFKQLFQIVGLFFCCLVLFLLFIFYFLKKSCELVKIVFLLILSSLNYLLK